MAETPSVSRLPRELIPIAESIRAAGGRALVVGGWVRDQVLGRASKDVDVEVLGVGPDALERVLGHYGQVLKFGKCFEICRVRGLAVDFSLPRSGVGQQEQSPRTDDHAFAEAARWRDLTLNAMGLDPCTGELLDPYGGLRDLEQRLLRATDRDTFGLDPLRVLRVAQLAARLELTVTPELLALCRAVCLDAVPAERVFEELRKLLLLPARPSVGFAVLGEMSQVSVFPQLEALIGVPQDPRWHPEGDVWAHTLRVVDEAARLRRDAPDDLALMLAALCHDLGKPSTTTVEPDRIRSIGHDKAGAPMAERFLQRLTASNDLARQVSTLVRYHLAPTQLVQQGATDRAYRRLARKLAAGGVAMELLGRLARADQQGRGGSLASDVRDAGRVDVVFLERAAQLAVVEKPQSEVVTGRDLIARGLRPGPHFAEILAQCRDYQDSTGCQQAETILARVLGGQPPKARR